ncbi:hypothetical protein DDZ14_18270 [Maritimibacter sp. 55A14]|uniref:hypothetical protein n=1 Tax=Maritimibacter sp. 55A14 TaxID=2174844 RepID=UPI000D61CE51|nr:hypothetical protein [Maritimibacter sp. 55A14]PWE28858.1 hypothetical protein DDZ14_18270 [Maritimibacter sp. 55A14]
MAQTKRLLAHVSAVALAATALTAAPAAAQGLLGAAQKGSFGAGGFSRYVPPVTHPTLNETPFITTELKPIYAYHEIPSDFLTGGGEVNVIAAQIRYAFSDRLGLIATTDGYSDLNFDGVLTDTDGFNDLTAGLKYAIYSNPSDGEIVTVGARYTLPVGNIDTNSPLGNIELNGTGNGYLDLFASGAKLYEGGTQVQGSIGVQIAMSNDNWSYVHAHVHVDHEIAPGFFPLLEANAIIPIDGGNRIPAGPLDNLTGADLFDIGADDPDETLTVAAGFRYRFSENAIFGLAAEKNLIENDINGVPGSESSVFDWRLTTDLTIHF